MTEKVLNSLFEQYLKDSFIKSDTDEQWSRELMENFGLQKKIVEGIRMRLSLDADIELFNTCLTPLELTEYISSAALKLKHKDNKGEHVYDDVTSDKNDNLLWGFLTNVPSEYYRLEHPRLHNVESYY